MSLVAQKTDMRYNLQTGKDYTITQTVSTVTSQDAMGMTVDVTNEAKYVISYKVKSFDTGIYNMEVNYKSILTESYSPYGNSKSDSDSDGQDPGSKLFRGMKDNPFNIKMTDKGEVTEVTGLDEMIEKIISDPSFSAQEKAVIREQLKPSFDKESFKKSITTLMSLPKDPIAVGDKWDHNTAIETNGIKMDINTKYEYAGMADGMWIIKGTSTIKTPAGTRLSAQGMDMDVDLKGTMTSEMKYDQKTGWISAGTTKEDVNGTMSMEIPMQGPMDIGVKTATKSTISGK
jgi:hypothetical protein